MRGLPLSPGSVALYLLRLLVSSLPPSAPEAEAIISIK